MQRVCTACGIRTRTKSNWCSEHIKTRACSVVGCVRKASDATLCGMHGLRVRRGEPLGPPGPLLMHEMDRRQLKPPKFCTVEGCAKRHAGRGYCSTHLARLRTTGEVGPAGLLRRAAGMGGYDQNGYLRIGTVSAHRAVMERMVGRPLWPDENVHHINGMRDDNRPENLELWSTSQPSGQRVEDKIQWAAELLKRYAPERLSDAATEHLKGGGK